MTDTLPIVERLRTHDEEYPAGLICLENDAAELIEKLTEALKPFAREAGRYAPDEDDSHIHIWGDAKLTLGDLREARAALELAKKT